MTAKLYLVELTLPKSTPVRILVPADSQAKARARVIDQHVSVRLVGGVEALALAQQEVPVMGDGE